MQIISGSRFRSASCAVEVPSPAWTCDRGKRASAVSVAGAFAERRGHDSS